jgi:hypothetical protein
LTATPDRRTPRARLFIRIASVAIGVVIFSAVVATSQPASPQNAGLGLSQERLNKVKQILKDSAFNAAEEQYLNRALPNTTISMDQALKANSSFGQVQNQGNEHGDQNGNGGWQLIGPTVPTVPGPVTYTGRTTTESGRVTSLAVAPTCVPGNCRLYVGAAGGGIWITDDALAVPARWRSSSAGMQSNSIGSITIDPTDRSGRTIYVGTGEPNGSTDSEAGIGLYKSTNGGRTWQLVQGSVPVSRDRSIAAVVVDPTNARHLLIGTAVARHGHSAVYGGRHTPPGAPPIGIYESTNGGRTWSAALILPQDSADSTASGSDFFKGGISDIQLDQRDPTTVYASTFVWGVWRRSARLDGDATFHQILTGNDETSQFATQLERAQIAVTAKNGHTLVYAGLGNGGTADSNLWRADNADVPAAQLLTSKTGGGPGWTDLSNPTAGTPGFASFNWCAGQCSYDMPIASPPGHPDNVWIGGQMQYDDIGQGAIGAPSPSNGRTILRSVDGGASFTDMTNDTQSPPLGMHPDQHAIVFASSNPDIAFIGSDGGVVRTSGQFADTSSTCTDAKRGNSLANLTDCQMWLKAIPTRIFSLNAGLPTLQYQHVSINPSNPRRDVMGGTQDNGTWAWSGSPNSWFETVGGDGGLSGTDVANPNIRIHTYTGTASDTNFHGTAPSGWDFNAGPMLVSPEAGAFYSAFEMDPTVSGSVFAGMQHIWRTQDSGGSQAYLDANCNELAYNGNIPFSVAANCGDWVSLGGTAFDDAGDLTGAAFGADRAGFYVVAIARAASDKNVMWAATRLGRIFVSTNAQAPAADVRYTRIDTPATPGRFVSNIVVDPENANHAWISYSGYNAFTPATPGHVFDVRYNPEDGTARFTDLSYNLGDQPITAIARDHQTGNLYAATDFGVLELHAGKATWRQAASGLPPVAIYSLALSTQGRVLYAGTHGRSIYQLDLGGDVNDNGGGGGGGSPHN